MGKQGDAPIKVNTKRMRNSAKSECMEELSNLMSCMAVSGGGRRRLAGGRGGWGTGAAS